MTLDGALYRHVSDSVFCKLFFEAYFFFQIDVNILTWYALCDGTVVFTYHNDRYAQFDIVFRTT